MPEPKQQIMRANMEAFTEPVRIYVLMKRPGEPAARKMRLPGDMGGVEAAIMFSYKKNCPI